MNPLGTGRGSFAICGTHFSNHWTIMITFTTTGCWVVVGIEKFWRKAFRYL